MRHYCIVVKYKRTNKKVDELKINIKRLKYSLYIYILGDFFIEEHSLFQKLLPLQKIFLLNHFTKQRRYFLEYFDA